MSHSKRNLDKRYFFSKSPQKSEDYTAFWIRYKPERVGMRRLNRSNVAIAITVFAFVAASSALCFLGVNHILSVYLMMFLSGILIGSVISFLNIIQVFAPTHIELNEKGLLFHWLTLFLQAKTPLISWDRISHVTTVNKNVTGVEEVTLEFNVVARGINFKRRWGYMLLAPRLTRGWVSGDRALVRFEIDSIASSEDRKRLQLALKKFLPSYRIEPKVADDLDMYMRFESYTDLWLEKLSEDSNRNRDSKLEKDTALAGGKYKIVETIGSGGQALVYLAKLLKPLSDEVGKQHETMVDMSDLAIAFDQTTGRPDGMPSLVVLKEFVLPTQAGANIRKRVLENIQKEASLWRKLRHPNIARLLDFFVEDQRAYLALEHVEGITLKELVTASGAIDEETVVSLSIQLCDILGYLHRRQPPVIHRDFTPDNLIMDNKGTIKLIDFNVAQQLEAQTTKTVVGKHSYIPPEQFRGKAVPQSDIYALGATLAFLLCGKDPEPITQAHPRNRLPALSQEVDDVVAKCTALSLSTRYQDCQELKNDLVALIKRRESREAGERSGSSLTSSGETTG